MLQPGEKIFKNSQMNQILFLTANQIPNYLTLWLDQILFSCSDIIKKQSVIIFYCIFVE